MFLKHCPCFAGDQEVQIVVLTPESPAAIIHMMNRQVSVDIKPAKDGTVTLAIADQHRGLARFYQRSAN